MVVTNPYSLFNFGVLHMEWPTALFVLFCFTIVLISLGSLLFQPILETLYNRQEEIKEKNTSTKRLYASIAQAEADYLQKKERMYREMEDFRQQQQKQTRIDIDQIFQQAHKTVLEKFDEKIQEIEKEKQQAHLQITEMAKEISTLISQRIIH